MFDNPELEITYAFRTPPPVVPAIAMPAVAPLPDKPTHAEVLKRPAKSVAAITSTAPCQMPPGVVPSNATHKGTKPSRVYSKVPKSCRRDLLPYRLNTVLLQQEVEKSIVATTGGPLLDHIKLQRSYWSTNRQFIILQFRSPLADEDHAIFEHVFSHFYDQDISVKDFIRKNVTSPLTASTLVQEKRVPPISLRKNLTKQWLIRCPLGIE